MAHGVQGRGEEHRGAALTGRILVDGRPLAGAQVLVAPLSPAAIRRPDAVPGQGRTAYDGSFAVRHLEAGPHEILFVGQGGGSATPNR